MNTSFRPIRHRVRPPADPMDYVGRRLSSLPVTVAAFVALVGAGVLDSAGVPGAVAAAAGVAAFVAIAWAAQVTVGHRIRHRAAGPR